jgi:hypothetical protein
MISIRLFSLLVAPLFLFFNCFTNCQQTKPAPQINSGAGLAVETQTANDVYYETRRKHDPNGIGKFYMGREIAYVMGYQGAGWLERPERIEEERPDEVVAQMGLRRRMSSPMSGPEPATSASVSHASFGKVRSLRSICNQR